MTLGSREHWGGTLKSAEKVERELPSSRQVPTGEKGKVGSLL